MKNNCIDPNKYNSDKIYKMIKKYKIPYNSLTKDSILNMIINYEKTSKVGKVDTNMLKTKTARKKGKEKENLYSEKINKRTNKKKIKSLSNINSQRRSLRTRTKTKYDFEDSDYEIDSLSSPKLTNEYQNDLNFISNLTNPETEPNGDNQENINIIIDKSVLFNNYLKEEEEKSRTHSSTKTEKQEFHFEFKKPDVEMPINTIYVNKNLFDHYMLDYHQPLISPICSQLYPISTKNHFNIDMMINPYDFTINKGSLLRSPVSVDKYINKEINMQNKILINDDENKSPNFDVDTNNMYINQYEKKKAKTGKTISLDMDVVNNSDTSRIFKDIIENDKNQINSNQTDKIPLTQSVSTFSLSPKSAFSMNKK